MAFENISAEHECNPRRIPNDDSAYTHYVVKSGVTIYKGSLVVFEYDTTALTGYVTYASNLASETFAGVAAQTATGDGTAKIKVWRKGLFEFIKGTPAITDVGTEFYCDGGTSGTPATVQSGTATGCKVGCCVDYLSSTAVLAVDNYCP
ncbi:MAG: hypothetical protein GTN49_04980 [candidate division Zixibacteria bacterium]|nr:hypothetical protein [candidate division Zixibacteria bacterium]